MGMKLEIKNATCGYDSKAVLRQVSLGVETSEILCLLGPNGAGKTTFLKTILGLLKLQAGEICLDGKNIGTWPRRKLAQVMGYIPQAHTPPFPFKVLDVVLMGRTAHIGPFSSPSEKDVEIARETLTALNIAYLADRPYTEISGGERQMVLIARALAQQPQILIMDEPTSNLDFGNQVKMLNQIKKLADKGLAIIMTSHFPDHAFICASKVALINQGAVEVGPPEQMITEANLSSLYHVNTRIVTVKNLGAHENWRRICVPIIN